MTRGSVSRWICGKSSSSSPGATATGSDDASEKTRGDRGSSARASVSPRAPVEEATAVHERRGRRPRPNATGNTAIASVASSTTARRRRFRPGSHAPRDAAAAVSLMREVPDREGPRRLGRARSDARARVAEPPTPRRGRGEFLGRHDAARREHERNGTTFSVGRTDRPLFQSQDSGVSQTRERSDRLGSPASGSAADSHPGRVGRHEGARAHSHVASRPAMT